MTISIILTVYNGKEYLEKCILSIINQTYKDFELIIIDDGSTDGSSLICDKYKEKDNRIKLSHVSNCGTSAARNIGIKLAKGDYITFIDNDDYWNSKDCLEKIVCKLNELRVDLLIHHSITYWEDTKKFEDFNVKVDDSYLRKLDYTEALSYYIELGLVERAVWSKVIKASLIKDNNIIFPEGKRNEDTYFTGKVLLFAKSIIYYSSPFYIYRKGHKNAQTSKQIQYSHVNDLKFVCVDYIKFVENNIKDLKLKKVLLSYIAYPYCVWLGQSRFIHNKQIKNDRKMMKTFDYVLNNNIDPYVKIISKIYNILGFKITSFLLYLYIKRKYY